MKVLRCEIGGGDKWVGNQRCPGVKWEVIRPMGSNWMSPGVKSQVVVKVDV